MSLPRLIRPLQSSIPLSALAGPSRLRTLTFVQRKAFTNTIIRSTSSSPITNQEPIQRPQSSSPNEEQEQDGQDNGDPEPQPKSAYARFKLLTKKYGWYALGMYTFLSGIDFSLCFLMVHAIGVEKIEPFWLSILYKYRTVRFGKEQADALQSQSEAKIKEDEEKARLEKGQKGYWGSRVFWAEVVLAYGIHKTALLPFRAGLTVAWTPKVVNWLASRGWIGKGGFGRAATHAKGKVKDASERVKAVAQREK